MLSFLKPSSYCVRRYRHLHVQNFPGNSLFFSTVFFLFQLDNAISKDAQCLCQRMSLNNRTKIAGSRRVYHKACIRLSKCACGKTDGDAASPNKKYSKIPCGDSQTAQLSSQRPRVAEGSYPENETTEKNDEDNGRRRGGGGPTKN